MCNQPLFGLWLLQKLGDSEVTGGCAGVFISAGRPKGKSEGESRPGILDLTGGEEYVCPSTSGGQGYWSLFSPPSGLQGWRSKQACCISTFTHHC